VDRFLRPPNVLLISDGAASYRRFAQAAALTHEWLNVRAGIRARGDIHLQNVNGWHARFKNWMIRFHGVASRYLAHYSGWQRIRDEGRLCTTQQLLLAAAKLN
jgi:hypothetical protein